MKASLHHRPATLDAKSIKRLMEVMRVLKSADCPMDVDQMWNNCFPVLCQGAAKTSPDTMGPLARLKSTLNELKYLLSAFSCLMSSLERTISLVEANYKSMVLSHGMKTAPVEVLDRIFEMVYCKDIRMAFNLSLVNKQFHDIAMRNPRLWNKISNFDPVVEASLGQLQVCLKRSKDVGLEVELDFDNEATYTDGVEILGIAVPEASRWESVCYIVERMYGRDWLGLFWDISRYSTGLDLPRLRSATFRYPELQVHDEDDPESIIDQSDPLMHFYTTWYLPKLTNLTVYNIIPRPFLRRVAPPLTTLTLDITEFTRDNTMLERVYDMNLLLEFLRSSPLLETFFFKLELDSFIPSTRDDDRTLPETVLPNLRTFDFMAFHLTAQSLLPFMKALRFPSLRKLHVCVDADVTEIIAVGRDIWLDCVLPHSYEQYMNVEIFSYKTREPSGAGYSGRRFSYDIPFAKLHNLRSITLETPYLKPDISRSCYDARTCTIRLPRLEDIRFVQCGTLDRAELRSFKELLEKQGNWNTLKKVTVKGCKSLSESMVRSLFEGKDVIWKA